MGRRRCGLVFGVWVFVLLVAMFGVLNVPVVSANGTIYIREDGSIDPPTALITTVDNVTYTFTGNITSDADGIVVERSNITIDGKGHTLQGSGYGNGFSLSVGIVTIKGIIIKGFATGISASSSTISGIKIEGNEIKENGKGIYLYAYSSCYNPDYSHSYSYIYDIYMAGNTISSNRGNGVYLYSYSFSTSYTQYSGSYSYSYIYGINMTGNTISSNQGDGVYLHSESYSSSSSSTSSHPYIYNVSISGNTISSNQGNGIYLDSESLPYSEYSYSESYIYDIYIMCNTISSNQGSGGLGNQGNGIYLYSYSNTVYSEHSSADSYIYDIYIMGNTVSSNQGSGGLGNQGNGIYLDSYSGVSGSNTHSYIYDVSVSGNTISLNQASGGFGSQGNGICLSSYSHVAYPAYSDSDSYIYDINMTGNTISSNKNIGIYDFAKNHAADVEFDLLFTQNKIHSNSQGIIMEGGIIANLTQNSIARNTKEGILFNASQNSEAHYNDIYGNGYGMNISNGATVDAERNYWGDSSGPYHESLNPNGKGNSVNGNGTDLDFVPFLTNPVDSTPPTTLHDYDDLWHVTDFTITLMATDDMNGVAETYYILNNGTTQNVTAYGQPLIITEGANNTLEYWSVDNVGNEESHHILIGIKLDKIAPAIGIPSCDPAGDVQPYQSVKVSVNVTDIVGQVKNVTLYYTLNNGTTWEEPLDMGFNALTNLYEATIPGQQPNTRVKYKIIAYDQAGNNKTLAETEPYCTYQTIPEFPSFEVILPFMAAILITAAIYKRKQARKRLKTV